MALARRERPDADHVPRNLLALLVGDRHDDAVLARPAARVLDGTLEPHRRVAGGLRLGVRNIESARRVDVLEGGVIVGDVKAGSITVAAGSRMRGHVEFGWDEEKKGKLPGSAVGS